MLGNAHISPFLFELPEALGHMTFYTDYWDAYVSRTALTAAKKKHKPNRVFSKISDRCSAKMRKENKRVCFNCIFSPIFMQHYRRNHGYNMHILRLHTMDSQHCHFDRCTGGLAHTTLEVYVWYWAKIVNRTPRCCRASFTLNNKGRYRTFEQQLAITRDRFERRKSYSLLCHQYQ